jgi:signal transduction histidine kinase
LDSRAVFAAAVRLGRRLLEDYVHYAELTVSDNGTGIKNVDRSEVFDPFCTTRLEDGGSGLGLSVVHGVIGDHGGKIEIEQPIEGGTRFRIILPLARPAVQA